MEIGIALFVTGATFGVLVMAVAAAGRDDR